MTGLAQSFYPVFFAFPSLLLREGADTQIKVWPLALSLIKPMADTKPDRSPPS